MRKILRFFRGRVLARARRLQPSRVRTAPKVTTEEKVDPDPTKHRFRVDRKAGRFRRTRREAVYRQFGGGQRTGPPGRAA